MRRIFILFSLILLPASALSQYNQGLRAGGRAISLGGSLVVQARDPSAILWNPALLSGLKDREMVVSVNNPFEFEFVSASTFIPLYGTFGGSLSRIPVPNSDDVQRATLAWGRRAFGRMSVGGNLNVQQQDDDFTVSTGWGIFIGNQNVGALGTRWRGGTDYDMWDRLNIGFAIQDIPVGTKLFDPTGLVGLSYLLPPAGLLINTGYHFRNGYNSGHIGFGLEIGSNIRLFSGIERLDFDLWGGGLEYQHDNLILHLTYSERTKELFATFSFRLGAEPRRLAARHYQRAARLLRNGDQQGALRELKKFQAYDLDDSLSLDVPSMVAALDRTIQRRSFKVDSLTDEVNKMIKGGQPQVLRAALILSRILELDPENENARMKLLKLRPVISDFVVKTMSEAIHEYDTGNYVEAQALFRRVTLFGDPDSTAQKYLNQIDDKLAELADQHYTRGLGYYSQKQYDDAIVELNLAKELNPQHENLDTYLNRAKREKNALSTRIKGLLGEAKTSEKNGKFVEASRKYLAILELDSHNEDAKERLRNIRPNLEDEIERAYSQARQLKNGPNPDYAAALEKFKLVLSMDPNHAGAQLNLATVRQQMADSTREHLRAAEAYEKSSDWTAAEEQYNEALKIDSDNKRGKAGLQRVQGRITADQFLAQARKLVAQEQYKQALDAVDKATQSAPDYDIVQKTRYEITKTMTDKAELLFKEGIEDYAHDRYTDALEKWQRVLQLNPAHPGVKDYIKQATERAEAIKELQ